MLVSAPGNLREVTAISKHGGSMWFHARTCGAGCARRHGREETGERMMKVASSGLLRLALLLVAGAAQAATLDEDEARIEALLKAEQTAAAAAASAAEFPVVAQSMPAPVVAQAIAPAPSELSNDDWLAPPPSQDSRLSFEDLAQHIGARVAVVTVNERVHRGIVTAVNARGLTLRVPRAGSGGGAIYTLRREQVARIDAR
jgi:hypothetical protein